MLALIYKELYTFFRSAIGYVVIGIFLVILSLFLFFFPTQFNILQVGVASFEPMYLLAPWLFIFFIPAITMKAIAEEKKQGTLEFLITKPLSEAHIILAKYLASLVILLLALIPTLVYFFLVQYVLSDRVVDTGSYWGSMFGLFLLGSVFAAIGIFASSLTSSQIIAFIIALLLEVFMFSGFDLLSRISFLRPVSEVLSYMSVDFHYRSLSKGVLDSRDIIYLISVAAVFLYLSVLNLKHRD